MSDDETLQQVVFDTADPSQGFFARKLPPSSGDSTGGTGGSGSGDTTSTDGTRAAVHVYDIPDPTELTPSADGKSTVIYPIKIPLLFATGDNKAPHRVSLSTDLRFDDPADPKSIDIDYICYRVSSKIDLGTAYITTATNCTDNTITMPVAPQPIRGTSLPVYIQGYKVADAPTNGYANKFTSTLDFIICPNKMNSTGNGESKSLPVVGGGSSRNGIIKITQGMTVAEFSNSGHTRIVQNFIGSQALPYYDTLELVISGTVSRDITVSSAGKIIMTVL